MRKKVLATILTCTMVASVFMGCGNKSEDTSKDTAKTPTQEAGDTTGTKTQGTESPSKEELNGTITFAIWDNNLNEFIEQNDMVGKFQKEYPNIEIEVEKIKDDSEYWNAMKMRASANQLPDIMFNKPFTLSRFKDYLLDLTSTKACENNESV